VTKGALSKPGETSIKLDLTVLMGIISNSTNMDKKAINALFIIFWRIYKDIPIMKRIFYYFFQMTHDFKSSIIEHLPSIVLMVLSDERLRQNTFGKNILDQEISKSIVKWMEGCITLLDKEKITDTKQISKLFMEMLNSSDIVVEQAEKIAKDEGK
jgi:phosphatidylinositol kinase/protein kinase (PI-3  family)